MPKPDKNHVLIKEAIQTWNIAGYTFVLVNNYSPKGGFIVRVYPHDDRESFWMDDHWETESGAAWSILNWLNEE